MTALAAISLAMTILSLLGLFASILASERHEGLARTGCVITPVLFIVFLTVFGASAP